MKPMNTRTSTDYEEGLTAASLSALLELGVTLRSYSDSIVLVGGWAPYFLIRSFGRGGVKHIGSIDIDLAVDPAKVDAEAYATIVELIRQRGWKNRANGLGEPIQFSFAKAIPSPADGREYNISVDFMTAPAAQSRVHRHRRVQSDLPARAAGGCGIAFGHNMRIDLSGTLPGDGEARSAINALDMPGCIGMKGIVLGERYKEKDAYDIFSVVANCLKGPKEVAAAVKPHLGEPEVAKGVANIEVAFQSIRANGPSWVAAFIAPADAAARERAQAEAYAVMAEFLERLEM